MSQDNSTKPRTIGILLHPTSLPNTPVCGTFGSTARDWLRVLSNNGIGVWQFLPLSPPDKLGSPYSSPSSFSFNPWFLDANDLIDEDFLPGYVLSDLPGQASENQGHVDFELASLRSKKIGQLLKSFWPSQTIERHKEFADWCDKQFWLKDHCIFLDLRKKYNSLPWWDWSSKSSKKDYLKSYSVPINALDNLLETALVQWHLHRQWKRLKELAKKLGVLMFGDLPFYVSRDSADVWSNSYLFSVLEKGDLSLQSGVPPDYFSDSGQLWGTPVYRWKKHKATNYKWWRRRLSRHLEQVDLLRIDHFRAFDSYWAVNGNEITAKHGYWKATPGKEILNSFKKDSNGRLPLIAEDLGVITPKVKYLRDHFRLPGMKILQFAFDGNEQNPYLPENIIGNNWIVYTGTHDNSTTLSWWDDLEDDVKAKVSERFKYRGLSPSWEMIEMGMSTDACLFIAPIQDILCLNNDSRFNIPGTTDENNWTWRLKSFDKDFEQSLKRYREMSELHNRTKDDALLLI